ncbi:PTS sugar transporter subunit IIA [Alicyclobacillus vulcanalis]|uniref:PTS system IIA component, Fru family n=1 Tax=Alicyclobacillus vulcanalis TaxID=252246 RepID=A0A1N7M3B0_9BACL|nr:fructose PTS transporter subunit IIA [Alicyclobacillus vulcanalis]SIS80459.1 PTS system IIA component, Fru family [Alicyclobacillus vulcanalis]
MAILTQNDVCFLDESVTTQSDVIRRMVELASEAGYVEDVKRAIQAVEEREREGTTGFGKGIAIPHGKSSAIRRAALLFAKLAKPVDWNSLDGGPVDMVFLILVPEGAHSDHLRLLSQLARKLMHDEFVVALREAQSADTLVEVISSALEG